MKNGWCKAWALNLTTVTDEGIHIVPIIISYAATKKHAKQVARIHYLLSTR